MMQDSKTTVQDIKNFMQRFVAEREWTQFHTPKNLSMCLNIEVAELMELFQWCDNDASWQLARIKRTELEHEMADVLAYLISLANVCEVDLSAAYERKMQLNAKKYPIEKVKGRSDKYTTYQK
jgi:NTP pyrophosphatase (non-canonical NTP hydrolase)